MEEIWKDIKGYEGLYEVSNLGRVRSLRDNHGQARIRVLQQCKSSRGYLHLILCKNHKLKHYSVHRLVAEAFLPNPDGLPQINHIDECKTNNRVDNLEWCDAKYNINYGSGRQRRVETQGKRVYQYAKSGAFVRSYASIHEAERQTGIHNGNISACCLGKRNSTGKYIWSFNPPTPDTCRSLW